LRAASGPPIFVAGDTDRLRRAIAALIENALKHCPLGVAITLQVDAGPASATIAVCDDGPGVDFSRAQELFERFRRGESRGEGSGLGLSLVAALAEAHGGRARLEPHGARGTRAVIELPLPAAQEVAA
jgi:two-component system OmpR family sensor kinase